MGYGFTQFKVMVLQILNELFYKISNKSYKRMYMYISIMIKNILFPKTNLIAPSKKFFRPILNPG
jgi:hypothetical protein